VREVLRARSERRRERPFARIVLGVAPREASPIAPDVVSDRLLLPMINEAAHCLADGVVASAARLDLAMIFGTGFPPFRGGLLRHADSLGAERIRSRLEELAERFGTRFVPAERIREMARAGAKFHDDGVAGAAT